MSETVHAAKRALGTLVDALHARIELVSLDWEEERVRLGRIIAYAAAGLLFAGLAVIGLAAAVVVFFWDTHRMLALAGVIAALGLAAVFSVVRIRALARAKPRFFAATIAELARDREALAELGRRRG